MRIVDAHCHVVDPARFPFGRTAYRPSGHEIAPVEELLSTMAAHGVERAVIVGTNSGYGEDLGPVRDALARAPGRLRGVAVVAAQTGEAELAALKDAGFTGVAFNAPFHSGEHYLAQTALVRRVAALDMVLQLQIEGDQLLAFLPMLEASGVRLVVDHCGRPLPGGGVGQPGFQALLALGRERRAAVKLSGVYRLGAEPRPFLEALLEAFGPEGCLWGSDFPFLRAPARLDWGGLIAQARALVPDPAAQRLVFWANASRVFGFAPEPEEVGGK